jgi:hypothetical protein
MIQNILQTLQFTRIQVLPFRISDSLTDSADDVVQKSVTVCRLSAHMLPIIVEIFYDHPPFTFTTCHKKRTSEILQYLLERSLSFP